MEPYEGLMETAFTKFYSNISRTLWIYCTTKMDNQQEEKIVLIVRLSADNTNANTDFNKSEPYINVLSDDTINRNIRSLNQEQG